MKRGGSWAAVCHSPAVGARQGELQLVAVAQEGYWTCQRAIEAQRAKVGGSGNGC